MILKNCCLCASHSEQYRVPFMLTMRASEFLMAGRYDRKSFRFMSMNESWMPMQYLTFSWFTITKSRCIFCSSMWHSVRTVDSTALK